MVKNKFGKIIYMNNILKRYFVLDVAELIDEYLYSRHQNPINHEDIYLISYVKMYIYPNTLSLKYKDNKIFTRTFNKSVFYMNNVFKLQCNGCLNFFIIKQLKFYIDNKNSFLNYCENCDLYTLRNIEKIKY